MMIVSLGSLIVPLVLDFPNRAQANTFCSSNHKVYQRRTESCPPRWCADSYHNYENLTYTFDKAIIK